mmetsp:Transcript_5820/g.8775  ORF Transcript_5820/g.8775 Transcript_5820/m.8775 type:complete len:458 (+) Transcript_5820:3-1376(+)
MRRSLAAFGNKIVQQEFTKIKFSKFRQLVQEYPPASGKTVARDHYDHVIKECAKHKRYEDARALIEEMKDTTFYPSTNAYNSFLSGCLHNDDAEQAECMFQEMQLNHKTSQPDIVTYNILIALYSNRHQFDEALELIGELQDTNIRPTQRTYFGYFEAMRKYDLTKAIDFLLTMKEKYGIHPNTHFYNGILDSLAKSSSPESVFGLFDSLKEKGYRLDKISYQIVFSVCAKLNRTEKMAEYWTSISENVPLDGDMVWTFSEIIAAGCDNCEYIETLIKFAKRKGGFDSSSCVKLLGELGKQKKFNLMLQMENLLHKNGVGVDVSVYNCLIFHLGSNLKFDIVSEIVDRMKQCGVAKDVYTYGALMSVYFKAFKHAKILALVKEMQDEGVSPNITTQTIVLRTFMVSNKTNAAKNLLLEMVSQDLVPNDRTWAAMRGFPEIYKYALSIFGKKIGHQKK